MSIYNNQWISVSHINAVGHSYIRLQDIERVSTVQKQSGDTHTFWITVFVREAEYLYTTKHSNGDAESASIEVLRLIETASGRWAK